MWFEQLVVPVVGLVPEWCWWPMMMLLMMPARAARVSGRVAAWAWMMTSGVGSRCRAGFSNRDDVGVGLAGDDVINPWCQPISPRNPSPLPPRNSA